MVRGSRICPLALLLLAGLGASDLLAQGRGRGAAGPPVSGRAGAPADFTGYWVSVVTEQWHLRMLVPPKGDFSLIPLNGEARKIAEAWDPAKEPAGNECAAYGAAAIMRVPGRLYIHWADDNTLQVDTDSGTQTRLFRFGSAAGPAPSERSGSRGDQASGWQGYSVAAWERQARGRAEGPTTFGRLRVTTTRMRPGYLRRNGVPYGASATVQEHFERFSEPSGDTWLVVTGIVTDPQYLTQPYVTTVHFKKIPDKSGWDPTPCRVTEAR
jgi:hypothetical protein